ncbi:MAG: methylmalonyl-CoA mutase small subunit [Bacteroidetes bacterium HGW-Bacteroidetes-21]|jgi:methylmalonyl-CoA mutase|nr:MAG: methylmalonyl-CoA mutase small subunit [Bacteroidetes bacterium HGW-Bacteroidetes-21]
MSEHSKEKLFDEFPPISVEQWEEVILKDLKGEDYRKKLIWNSPEGIPVRPFYTKNDTAGKEKLSQDSVIRGNADADWDICEEIYVADLNKANATAMDALAKGATAINFILQDKICAQQSEVISSKEDLATLLKGIDITKTTINFISGNNTPVLVSLFDEYFKGQATEASKVKVNFDFDPIGHLTLNGNFFFPRETVFSQTASLLKFSSEVLPEAKVLGINGYFFHNAAATSVQELAYSLAIADDYLSRLTDLGIPAAEIIKRFKFTFGVGSNYFMEIAKFRAFRWLWAKIAEQYLGSSASQFVDIHVVNSNWNKTVYDPHVNILRATTEAMSAVLGGAKYLSIRPFDAVFHSPTDQSRRIARNLQIVLKEEAYFSKVNDIAGGSYYIESLTESLAQEAWKLFLEVNEKGGYTESFLRGEIQQAINESAQKRRQAVSSRQNVLLGTNQYPNLNEKVKEKVSPCAMSSLTPAADMEIVKPIELFRGSEAFENLRLTVESMPRRPKVFLLTHGSLAMRKARASFSTSFFGCAGYEVIDNLGFATVTEGADAALAAKSDIVVLCGSDDDYPVMVPEALKALNGKAVVVLAGYPKEQIEAYKEMGLKHFIHVKANLLDTLTMFNEEMKARM